MTTDTLPSSEQSAIEASNGNVVVYHRIEPHETAPGSIETIWELLQDLAGLHDSPNITLALDIEGHRKENNALMHEMEVLITEFIVPIGSSIADKIALGPLNQTLNTAEEGLDALNIESNNTEEVTEAIPEEMDTEEFIEKFMPVAEYDGTKLTYVFIYKGAYEKLSQEHGLDDSQIIEHTMEQMG